VVTVKDSLQQAYSFVSNRYVRSR